mgnify:CR=1 FL=1
MGKRSTLDLGGGYNPWNLDGTAENNKKLVHWLGEIEYRYWLCQRFSGHFLGVHVLGSQYNIAQQDLHSYSGKVLKNTASKAMATEGEFHTATTSFLGIRWSIEANLGIGYARLHYDKYKCQKCGEKIGTESRKLFRSYESGNITDILP